MQTSITLAGVLVAGSAILVGQYSADAVPGGGDDGGVAGALGADVIVGALPAIAKYGSVGGTAAYALATTSCNIGDEVLDWYANNNDHPVIPQNMYVVRDGRLEQIGMSWLKHGFCALQQSLCGACQPAGGGCPPLLGVGCSDPYSASLNGQQSNLGPRSLINAVTGIFPYPWGGFPPAQSTIGRRIQVQLDDLDPGLNGGARYFAEGMYISKQDSAAGNSWNNASYREFNVGSFSGGSYNLSLVGPTYQQKPAIFAWQQVHNDVDVNSIEIPDDGIFHVGSRASDNGDGTWRYSYVVYNLTSDLSGASLSISKAADAVVTNVGFHDIDYHSGEPYDNTDWASEVGKDAVTWSNGTTYAENPDANALRWNTAYTFWFDSSTPPVEGNIELGLFKNGESVTTTGFVPAGAPPIAGDYDNNGCVNGSDLAYALAYWGGPEGDLNGDGTTDGYEIAIVLANWGDGGCGG